MRQRDDLIYIPTPSMRVRFEFHPCHPCNTHDSMSSIAQRLQQAQASSSTEAERIHEEILSASGETQIYKGLREFLN